MIPKNWIFFMTLYLSNEYLSLPESSEKAEQVLCTALKKRILNFLYKTQKTDCDILGIGDHAKKNFLTEQGFNAYAWQEKYSKATFDVNISFRCTRRK